MCNDFGLVLAIIGAIALAILLAGIIVFIIDLVTKVYRFHAFAKTYENWSFDGLYLVSKSYKTLATEKSLHELEARLIKRIEMPKGAKK